MSTHANEPIRYVASFMALLVSLGTGVGLSYAIPTTVAYHEILIWAVITVFALLGLELMFRIEAGDSLVSTLVVGARQ